MTAVSAQLALALEVRRARGRANFIVAPCNAAAVAWGGTTPAIGAKKSAAKKQRAVTTEVNPVRPPSETPAADSI